jgi:hypothetical protein
MKYCRGCGFPAPYGKYLEWTDDGTILGRESTRTRLVYVDTDELANLFRGVTDWMGVPIDRIIYRAEKEVGRRFIKALLPGFMAKIPRGKMARPQFGVKAIGHYVFNYMAGLGMGRAEVIDYHSGRFARVRITNSHSIPLVAGDGAGVFEILERIGVDVNWERIRMDEYIVTLEKVSDEPPDEGRLSLEEQNYIPGDVHLQKCKKCGLPAAVTNNFYLDLEKGILRNSVTGMRVVALPVQSFYAVFRELAREFGKDLLSIVERLEKEYARECSGVRFFADAKNLEGVSQIYSEFPWKGIGNPVAVRQTQDGLEVVVDNPFHPALVAGKVAGTYEAWLDDTVEYTAAQESPMRLKVTMSRK